MLIARPTAQLRQRLSTFIDSRNASALRDHLKTLRHADFRAASLVMGEASLWTALNEAEFWTFFLVLVTDNAKAYLGTLLKAVVARHRTAPFSFADDAFRRFATDFATDIDRRKSLDALLPLVATPRDGKRLLRLFRLHTAPPSVRAAQLLRIATPVGYFLLFNTLREIDDDRHLLRRYAVELMRKGDKPSFNLACILREYFDLDELPGTFSLRLPPHELSRLDSGFDTFARILMR